MPAIAVDAMGGESAPESVVQGVADVSLKTDIQCMLVGDEARLQKILDGVSYNPENIAIVHAGESIGMDENPRDAARRRRASLLVAIRQVAGGRCAAVVSAGNTGAAVAACLREWKIIPGVRKVALAGVYPRHVEYPGQDQLALALDVGATARCEALELVQFAVMGSTYARLISKVAEPRVGLLNMGREDHQGGDVLVDAHRRLGGLRGINFVGNVEGDELTGGRADVIVCEGLLGHIVLRLLGSVAEVAVDLTTAAAQRNWRFRAGMAMLSSGVDRLRELADYGSYGGAPILGLEHVFIKAHERSSAQAIANAVKVAAKAVRDGVPREVRAAIAALE